MTVSSETAKSGPYTGNGVTTVFAYGFRILDAAHIRVVRTENGTDTVLTTGFTVSGVGAAGGGNVTFSVAPTASQKITLIRNAPFTQATDLENQGAYYAEVVEQALDLAAMRDQQMAEEIGRSVKLPVGAGNNFDADDLVASLLFLGDLYLGAKASAPSVDNQGDPLKTGAVYWDTVSNQMFTWSGAEWRPTFLTGNAVRALVTATGGQTAVTVPTYLVGANTISVYLNGLKVMVGADYTETNQNTITFLSGLTLGDEVEVIVLQPYAIGTTGAESITTEYGVTLARLLDLRDGTVAQLLADTTLNPAVVPVGSVIEAGGFRYQVAASGASDHHVATAGGVKLYVLPDAKGVRALEAFGIGASSTPFQVAAAITTALGALTDGQSLVQIAASYTTDAVAKVVAVDGIAVRLNLIFSGTGANAAFRLDGATNSLIDVSMDVNGASVHGVRLENCGYSTVPRSCRISNINGTTQVVAGLFLRDCPDMIVEPVISSVTGNGNHAVRGVMVSDQTISHNASRISPVLNNITITTGGASNDADGVYAENSLVGHYGGIQCVGGTYNNCQKRNIKISSARPVIKDNRGTNSLAVEMYAFISSYDKEAGHIVDNEFSKTGATGVVYMLDAGEQGGGTGDTRLFARGNRMRSATVASSSRGFRLDGRLAHVEIGPHEIIGAQGLLQSYGNTANTGQQIGMYGPIRFDNLSASGTNCVILTGNFSRLRIEGVNCVNAVASFFFLQAANCSDRIAEIIGVNQSYSFGFMSGGIRPMTAYDQTAGALNSIRYERGLVVHRRNSAPTSGAHIVGDLVERHSPSAGGKIGWVCTTAGTPGTWKEWGAIDV